MKPTFNVKKAERDEMIKLIQLYYVEEQGEKIGNIKAMLLLDFFMEKIAPGFYNMGIEDAHTYMTIKVDDIFELQK